MAYANLGKFICELSKEFGLRKSRLIEDVVKKEAELHRERLYKSGVSFKKEYYFSAIGRLRKEYKINYAETQKENLLGYVNFFN